MVGVGVRMKSAPAPYELFVQTQYSLVPNNYCAELTPPPQNLLGTVYTLTGAEYTHVLEGQATSCLVRVSAQPGANYWTLGKVEFARAEKTCDLSA